MFDVCVVCVVSTDAKSKCRTIKTKTQVRIKYKQSTREYNKNTPMWTIFSLPVQTRTGFQAASCGGSLFLG
jgi:hypothetical protein